MKTSDDAAGSGHSSDPFEDMAAGRGFTGADAATARLRTKDLRRLWCKFTPPVNIIFPVWNSSRWRTEFDKSIADRGEEAGRSVFPALGFPQKTALADWLVGLGPLVATGDMYALQYFLFMLTSMHGLKGIRLHEAWSLSGGLPSLAKPIGASSDLDEVLGQNIVIVGGPAGNPVAQSLLDVLNATSLFPDAPRSDFRIRKWGIPRSDKDAFLAPKIGTSKDQSDEDCGLLLVGRNPWSRDRSKWFMAAMGSASWGTQACAALACSDAGATELARSRVGQDPEIVDAGWVGEIGYVKVWPKLSVGSKRSDRLPDLTVPDSNFQMVFPYEGKLHSNPLAILSAGEMLRTAHKGPTNMEIGFRPAILLVAICCLCIASAIAAFGALSSQPWGPITCAVCLAAAGVSLVPRSLRVGQSAAKLSATPANPPPQ